MAASVSDPGGIPGEPPPDFHSDIEQENGQEPRHEKNFSDFHRELRDQIDPETGERVLLITRKQWAKLLKKELGKF